MQLTINVPDILPNDRILQFIHRVEEIFLIEGIIVEVKQNELITDPWDDLDFDKIAVDTGIEDFAKNHDHYLYGLPKR